MYTKKIIKKYSYRDIRGQKFGRLEALKKFKKNITDYVWTWACFCECGNFVDVKASALLRGNTRSCGCLKRKRLLDETAFDQITEESAYWIGFLMADGCISKSYKSKENLIGLELQNKDSLHIFKFRNFLKSSHKVGYRKTNNQCRIAVSSTKLSDKLKYYGVTSRKSFTANPHTDLSDNRHFWRGMIDGDGHISLSKSGYKDKKYPLIDFCGSFSAVKKFRQFCLLFINTNTKIVEVNNLFHFRLKCRKAKIIINELYKNSNIYLDRKFESYKEICKNMI